MPLMTGGEALVAMFQLHGIDHAFGMGGFQPLPYYDALARQTDIRHILIRDEKHGAFAADAYGRVRNRPAIADATLGPGATNLVSGAAESFGASIPLVLLTGEVNSGIRGRAATQESDQAGMLRPTVKYSVTIDQISRIPELVRHGVSLANGGRPGPVHLNVPEEVFHGTFEFPPSDMWSDPDAHRVGGRAVRPMPSQIDRAAEVLASAERPVVLVGGGLHLSEAYAQLAEFIEFTGFPVASTISGKGSIAEDHPLALGVFGRFSRSANELIADADVLLVVGSKLGEIATNRWSLLPAEAKLIHVDIDPGELGKIYRADVGVWGDAGLALADLRGALDGRRATFRARRSATEQKLATKRQDWSATAEPKYGSDEQPIHMARVLRELQRALPPDGIVVADGGFAAHWSALLFDVTTVGRTYIANRGHAAIGYGLPGAIGARLAAPDRPVVALCGDNGFAMAVAELETAKRAGAPVVCLVVNNGTLGYVKALQHGLYADRFVSVDFLDVDYAAVARGFGCAGALVEDPRDLQDVLRDALRSEVPYVIDARITTDPAHMLPGVDRRTLVAAGIE
jgi:acetolactate synthase-1/2/3 large subunit